MTRIWILFFTIFSSAFSQAHIPKEGMVYGTAGPYFYQTHVMRTQDYSNSPALAGVALLGEGDLSDYGGLEAGLFYLQRTYLRYSAGAHVVEKVHKLVIPFGYRYWPSSAFSLGIFFDSAFSNGDYQNIYNAPTATEGTSARENTEYGLEFSTQWEFFKYENFYFLLDARYFYSISAKNGEDANQYGILLGIKYLIQEK